MYNEDNLIMKMTFEFSKLIIFYTNELEIKRKFSLANQLFRSGTSIGASVREAQNAESKADFIHKMKIAAKEADETLYWLELCKFILPSDSLDDLLIKGTSIHKVLNKIIGSTKSSLQK